MCSVLFVCTYDCTINSVTGAWPMVLSLEHGWQSRTAFNNGKSVQVLTTCYRQSDMVINKQPVKRRERKIPAISMSRRGNWDRLLLFVQHFKNIFRMLDPISCVSRGTRPNESDVMEVKFSRIFRADEKSRASGQGCGNCDYGLRYFVVLAHPLPSHRRGFSENNTRIVDGRMQLTDEARPQFRLPRPLGICDRIAGERLARAQQLAMKVEPRSFFRLSC